MVNLPHLNRSILYGLSFRFSQTDLRTPLLKFIIGFGVNSYLGVLKFKFWLEDLKEHDQNHLMVMYGRTHDR